MTTPRPLATTTSAASERRWVRCQHCGHLWFLLTRELSRQCTHCLTRDWLAPGDTAHTELPRGKLRHRFCACRRCGYVWIPPRTMDGRLPLRCTNRHCGARSWQIG